MNAWLQSAGERLSGVTGLIVDLGFLGPLLQAALLIGIGWLLARTARRILERTLRGPTSQTRVLVQRSAFWTVFGLFLISAMRTLGFDFTVILGAAGILTAAVAFASQTTASNMISGLFLGLERTIEIGDIVTVDGVTGEVLSIDLLSTRMRTFDNLMVRIPNETMVKTRITNLNRYPIRRYDLRVGVAYDSDLAHVHRVLLAVADADPLILEEPPPLLIAQGFGASSIDLQLSVWARRENLLEVRNRVQERIHVAFDREGIEIPLPKLDLGSSHDPIHLATHPIAPDGLTPARAPEGHVPEEEEEAAQGEHAPDDATSPSSRSGEAR
ncbi:MAG: mechanosensitive ion channel family protein [Trueperaceae bacterium]